MRHYARLTSTRKRPVKPDDDQIVRMYIEGWSIRAIALELDLVYTTVRNVLHRTRTPLRDSAAATEITVTYDDYIRARQALATGQPSPIPKRYSLTRAEVTRLRREIGWQPEWNAWAADSRWDLIEEVEGAYL